MFNHLHVVSKFKGHSHQSFCLLFHRLLSKGFDKSVITCKILYQNYQRKVIVRNACCKRDIVNML